MLCNWGNNFPDVFRMFQPRWVRSRAQMTIFRCVADRFATFSHAAVHIMTSLDMPQNAGNIENPVFPRFSRKCRFSHTWQFGDTWGFCDLREVYFSPGFALGVCGIDVKTSRYLTFCRCARGFHVITVPHGAQIR